MRHIQRQNKPRASPEYTHDQYHESSEIIPRVTVDCIGGQCHESSSDVVPRALVQCADHQCFESRSIITPRDDSNTNTTFSPLTMNLLIALVILLFISICLIGALLGLRTRRRHQRREAADMPFQASPRPASRFSTHTLLTIATGPFARPYETSPINEKEILIDEESLESPIERSIPEIRITLPEETDEGGKRRSGRVVRVSVSEAGGVGFEPYNDEQLPSSQKAEFRDFQFVDLERIGGLKESNKF